MPLDEARRRAGKTRGISGRSNKSAALFAEVFVEVVEDRAAASEPFLVAPVRHHDAGDQSLDAISFEIGRAHV